MNIDNIEKLVKLNAPNFARMIKQAANDSRNEAEFRTKITRLIEGFAEKIKLAVPLREEYTLINGRADAVYERLIIEYENPGSLKESNSYHNNKHAIDQVKRYMGSIVRKERHKVERVAGVVLDGHYFIFVRFKENIWNIDSPLKVDSHSAEYFLKLFASLTTEKALIPENLVRDFGEKTPTSFKAVSTFYKTLTETKHPKIETLFEQWSLQFSEVCNYEEASRTKIKSFAKNFGITDGDSNQFPFFFCLHSYYALFIKLLAVQIVHYYTMPRLGTDLRQAATLGSEQLKSYFEKLERGGIFKDLGIGNLLEGDFFSWYLDIWNKEIYQALKPMVALLSDYSLVTLDVDPDTSRDMLKKLYQHLMPRQLRHNLGEYYTPDWLAERLLNMLEGGKFTGDPNKRLLDPSCGSGTFLVIAIKKIREYAKDKFLPESQVLEKILTNVVGFDLNPLAVISARTNYLLALGELLQHRKGEINIPVYLCDSILTPQEEGNDLFSNGILQFNTAVGPFSVPQSLVQAQYIDILANFLEKSVDLDLDKKLFVEQLTQVLPLNADRDRRDVEIIYNLYEKLCRLGRQGTNGIWARIIKNAFAPLFAGEFDYIAGNPPWVNWESLPEQYRRATKPLWESYGLFPHGGMDTILGKGKKDISMLMTFVSIDKYLKNRGKLGFLITQSLFKTSGAGQGFRRFQLGDRIPFNVIHVDDMVELNPFEGTSNRTSVLIIQKGRSIKYPMTSYLYWKKTMKRRSIAVEDTLEDILLMTERRQLVAEPVNEKDLTSAWITGRPAALKAIKKILGKSDYVAHAGSSSGGANAVYWVNIITTRPDGMPVISNLTEGSKRKVESTEAVVEPDLLYPLLRGRDVHRWQANPSAFILMVQDPDTRRGIDENTMKMNYPNTYLYLKRFEGSLKERAAFRRYFTRKNKNRKIIETAPFYSMFNVGKYTFAPYKVVWREVAHELNAAVTEKEDNNKVIIPDHTLILIAFELCEEAHYTCALLNSSPFRFGVKNYIVLHPDPHILENIRIPKFDPENKIHRCLAELSEKAHVAKSQGKKDEVNIIEKEIDELAKQVWDLTSEELTEIVQSLHELN